MLRSLHSRRSVLSATVSVLGGLVAVPLLAACGGQGGSAAATAAPAPTTAAAARPTSAPAATTAPAPTAAPAAAATTAPAPTATPAAAANAVPTEPPVAVQTAVADTGPLLVDPKTVKINGTFGVIQQKDWNPIHNEFLRAEVTAFAKEQGWPLNLSYEAGFTGGGNFNQKMAAAVSSGNGPDMVWGNYSSFTLWYLKTLQPIDDVMAYFVKQYGDVTPGAAPGNKIDGKWYAVPYFNRVGGWWARKSWYDAQKIDITTLKDFDQWKEAALAVSDPAKRMWGWGNTVNRSGDGENNVSTPWFEAGNRLTDETGQKVTFNTDLSIQAFDWIKDIYTNPKWQKMLPPGVNAWDDMGNNNAWNSGTIGFTSNAGTLFAAALKTVPQIGHDTFLNPQPAMPIGKKQALVGAGGSSTFYLMANAKNPEAAKALMGHLMSKPIQLKLFETSQGYVVPGYTWGWDTQPIVTCPNNVALIMKENLFNPNAFAWFQPAPNPLLWVQAVSDAVIFTDTMAAILKGQATKDAVADGQKKIEDLVKKFNGQ